jgi:hypothetical protein
MVEEYISKPPSAGQIERKASIISLDSAEIEEIIKLFRNFNKKHYNFDISSLIATDYGKSTILDRAHGRLVNLVKSGIVRNPDKIDFLSGRLPD